MSSYAEALWITALTLVCYWVGVWRGMECRMVKKMLIDPVDIAKAVKKGFIEFYVKDGQIFCKSLSTEKVMKVGDQDG